MAIKLLSFDLDNTLYDNSDVIKTAEKYTKHYLETEFKKENLDFDFQQFDKIKNELLARNLSESSCVQFQFDNLSLLRYQTTLKFCTKLSEPEKIAKNALEVFLKYRSQIKVSDVMLTMLKRLSLEYKIVSITNGNCDPSKTVLHPFFEKNYSPLSGLRAKPHPEMLLKTIKQFNLQKDQLLHVGDRQDADQLAAENAGCQFYLFAPFEPNTIESEICNKLLENLTR